MGSNRLIRKQIDKRLDSIRPLVSTLATPPSGWIRAIRTALGMSSEQLGNRVGISQPGVAKLELSERKGAISLNSLRKAAEALDCTLVYALIPNQPIQVTVEARARMIAVEQTRRVNHTMRLEAQDTDAEALNDEVERLKAEILTGNLGRLWD